MSYIIRKRFRFEAAHSMPSLPDGHKCRRLHGHSYSVELELRSSALDDHGFVRDYGDLREFAAVIEAIDHRNVDEVVYPSSAERLAEWLYHRASEFYPEVTTVRVSETETSWAEYRA